MSNQMLNATDPFCGCSKSTPTSPCNGGCGSPKPTACSPCVPSCHEQVNTYAELTANKSMFAGKYVSVMEEGGAVYHVSNDGNILEVHRQVLEENHTPALGAYNKTMVVDPTNGMVYYYLADGTYMQWVATHVTV